MNTMICTRPFERFEIYHEGYVYMCCQDWLETPIGNFKEQSTNDIWNGETAVAIRQSILDGSFKYCDASRCPYLQSFDPNGIPNGKEAGPVKTVEMIDDQAVKDAITHKQAVLPYGPRYVNWTFDPSCNLSCPTCRKQVYFETDGIYEIATLIKRIEEEILSGASVLYLSGSGDPFAAIVTRNWLQSGRLNRFNDLAIHLHTNGQLMVPGVWNKLDEKTREKIIRIEISIDAATAETYAINRRGGDFNRLLKNLNFIRSLRQTGDFRFVIISMVVQENNYREMPAFIELGKELGVDCVHFRQLVDWGIFSEEEYKQRAIHLPVHPDYEHFKTVLQDSLFDDPIVLLGNLSQFK